MLEGMTIRDTKGKPTIRDSKGKPRKLKKRPTDINQLAHMLGNQSTEQAEPEPTQAEILGLRGGKIGGKGAKTKVPG
jgi:hypothetical protein